METEVGNEKFIASEDDIIFVNKYYSHSYKVIGEYEKYVIIIPPRICNDFDDIFFPGFLADGWETMDTVVLGKALTGNKPVHNGAIGFQFRQIIAS